MEENTKSVQDYINILKRYKKLMLITTLGIFTLASLIALKWPPVYKSSATILIERQEIPEDLVRSTITSFADQRIQVISQRVMTSENIKAIIDKYTLYADDRKTETLESLFEQFREDVDMKMISADVVDPRSGQPTQATIAFTLGFNNVSPQIAQQVANELVSLYLNENIKRRSLAATEATDFLALEADKLKSHIAELENKLASFKEENANALPELQQLNLQVMDRTEQEVTELDRQAVSLNERKLYLEAELAQMEPIMPTFGASGERIFSANDRLKALQAEYIAIAADYSANHPDVIKLQKRINALEQEVGSVDKSELTNQIAQKKGELASLSKTYSPNHPDVIKLKKVIAGLEQALNHSSKSPEKTAFESKPDNPAYIQLQAQLQSATAELNALKASKSKLINKLTDLEKNMRSSPQVERQYHALMRDYENSTVKFREVKAKQMEADMSQAMEKNSKGEHFSLIEPPLFPEKPVKPNRVAIVSFGFFIALCSALGLAAFKASLDPSIYGSKELETITGNLPLVVIPYIENGEDILNKTRAKKQMIFGSIGAITLAVIILHFWIKPLDVLWFILMRKFGYDLSS